MSERRIKELENEKAFTPISSKTVVQQIIEEITSAISSGRFKLGEKLPSEFELMSELNVSRNSIREAMKIMSATGLVDIKRGDGTYICSHINPGFLDSVIYGMMFETSTQQEIVELRQMLDEGVLRIAIQKVTDEDIERLQWYIDNMRTCFYDGNYQGAAKLDYQFHIYLAECCHNVFLQRIVKGIYEILKTSIEKNIRTEENFASADEKHQLIVEMLRRRDDSEISKVVHMSLDSWRNNIKTSKSQQEKPEAHKS